MPTQPAILGTMRLGNFRLGYNPAALAARRRTKSRITIGAVTGGVREAGLTVHDAINDAPNTASFVKQGTAPVAGQDLRISINSDTPRLLFNGTIQTNDRVPHAWPVQLEYPCSAIDDLARLNRRRPFGTWVDVSQTTIAHYLIATFAPGFTSYAVQAGLPLISITFDGTEEFSSCLKRLASGGYYYVEDLDLHLFHTETSDAPDAIDGTAGRLLDDPPIRMSVDDSQVRTRVYGKGHGEAVPVDVEAGATIVPIADAVMFNPFGGKAVAGTTPDGAQSQQLAYTGVQLGGAGSLVGPGAQPSTAPTLTPSAGSGVETGVHQGAYTFVTAAGESLPSPLGSATLGAAVANPTSGPTALENTSGALGTTAWNAGDAIFYVVTYRNSGGETLASAVSATIIATAGAAGTHRIDLSAIPVSSDPAVVEKRIYRNRNGAWAGYLPSVTLGTTTFQDGFNATAGAPPGSNTTTLNRIAVAGVALGPAGTTARNYYRTAAGGAQLKLQQTIADNTSTTGVLDATPDASLGANVPTSDTSGLTQPDGQVNAGSTSLLTASAGPFAAGGGWLHLPGEQVVRYTGIAGNTLTGIPASGPGSMTTTVLYGTQVIAAPALTGVTGLLLPMQHGATVHLWVERNDLAAQAELIALDAAQGRVSDGVVEHTITDDRRGEASLIALCDADLAQFSRPIITVTYCTHDVKSKAGKTVHLDLPALGIGPFDLTMQTVDISEIDLYPGVPPRFSVMASNVRVSLDDLLRRALTSSTRRAA